MKIKSILIGLALAACTLSLLSEALAKPMGGGRSIGRQSHNVARQPPAPAPAPAAQRQAQPAPAPAPAAAPAALPPKPASPWKGILGGALLGLGLGALLSHFGLGGAFASLLGSLLMIALLAGAALLVYRLVKSKGRAGQGTQPLQGFGGHALQPQGTADIVARLKPQPVQPQAFEAPPATGGVSLTKRDAQWGVPADFDAAAFLRHAKTHFIRLQAAWDKADINDIGAFTTPEMYAELKLQIQERGAQADFTDVVTIDADLLGIETVAGEYLASVRFHGLMRTAADAQAEPFTEVWNMAKPVSGASGWVLAGIQQLTN